MPDLLEITEPGRVASDEVWRDHMLDGGLRRRNDSVPPGLAPSDDAVVRFDSDHEHVVGGPGLVSKTGLCIGRAQPVHEASGRQFGQPLRYATVLCGLSPRPSGQARCG